MDCIINQQHYNYNLFLTESFYKIKMDQQGATAELGYMYPQESFIQQQRQRIVEIQNKYFYINLFLLVFKSFYLPS